MIRVAFLLIGFVIYVTDIIGTLPDKLHILTLTIETYLSESHYIHFPLEMFSRSDFHALDKLF